MTDYETSGVSLSRAALAKKRIAAAARTTFGPHVLTDVGHFGGLFALGDDHDSHILVASADGVGTKLLLGVQLSTIGGLGRDLIHHCINDILMCGARPLFFLDYMAFGKLDPDVAGTIAESLAAACRDHNVALIGGETAEMPDLYAPDHFDLAGTIVGIVERDQILDGSRVSRGDLLLGVASNGPHTNGYSLIRKLFSSELKSGTLSKQHLSDGTLLAQALMKSHRCYLNSLSPLLKNPALHAMAHITGGGLHENTMRVIPNGLSLKVDWRSWPQPELFSLIQERGDVPEEEMRRVFNMGIGVVVIADPHKADELAAEIRASGETVYNIGRVVE